VGIPGTPFGSQASPLGINIDAYSRFLFNPTSVGISVYTISSTTGALTQISGSPFYTSISGGGTVTDPTGQFVFVSNNGSPNVVGFSVNQSTGALTELANSPFIAPSPYFSKLITIRQPNYP
jgi:6-phosphogluconolactonase (cycloisomerase 2 family)